MNILVLCKDAPAEIGSAGAIRLYRIIKAMKLLHNVDVVCSSADYGTNPLKKLGVEALVNQSCFKNIEKTAAEKDIDIIFISWWYIAKDYYGTIKRYMPNAKIIIDSVDLQYKRDEMRVNLKSEYVPSIGLGELQMKKQEEIEIYNLADQCWVASENDKIQLGIELPSMDIKIVPIIFEFNYPNRDESLVRKNTIVFIGNFLHLPNVDAVLWFGNKIFPKIQEKINNAEFLIVGKWAPKEIQELELIEGIEYRGIEYNLEKLLCRMDISVAPIRFLSGMNGKIVEAIAHEIPVVTTPAAAKVLNLEHEKDVMLGSNEDEFFESVIQLLLNEDLKQQIIINSKNKVKPIVDYEIVKNVVLESVKEITA